jgi:hypothetical protein
MIMDLVSFRVLLLQQHNGFADENKRAENGSKAAVPAKGSCLLQQEPPFLHHDAQMKWHTMEWQR